MCILSVSVYYIITVHVHPCCKSCVLSIEWSSQYGNVAANQLARAECIPGLRVSDQ